MPKTGLSGNDPIADIGSVGHINGMANKRGGITAEELLTQQAADPVYQDMRRARETELAEVAECRSREQRPLLSDLSAAGATVDWVGRLLETPNPDKRIYAVLLEHLIKPYSPWLLEWIGRAFGCKSARPVVWDTLVKLLKTHALEEPAACGVMVAISDMAQPSDLGTLIELISDQSLGVGRIFLVQNLMRSKKPEARATLLQLQDDPDIAKEITARLSRRPS